MKPLSNKKVVHKIIINYSSKIERNRKRMNRGCNLKINILASVFFVRTYQH